MIKIKTIYHRGKFIRKQSILSFSQGKPCQCGHIKGQMNQKIDIFSFVALPSPNTKKNHAK